MAAQPTALRLADELERFAREKGLFGATAAAAELRRLHALNAELLEALKGLDEAYCRAGSPLNKDERHEDRMRLISARSAIAKAEGA